MNSPETIHDLDALRRYTDKIVKLSRNGGRTWRMARLFDGPGPHSDLSGHVEGAEAITDADLTAGLLVQPLPGPVNRPRRRRWFRKRRGRAQEPSRRSA
jgi:hypothetical protein